MRDFQALLQSIAERPGMYFGKSSARALGHYLNGYCEALQDLGHPEKPLGGWQRWVELRFMIQSPAWHWTRILQHHYKTDREVIEAMPELHRLFVIDRAEIGNAGIEATLNQRLIEVDGQLGYEPSETHTAIEF